MDMTGNIKVIYDFIQKDLKAKGWCDDDIAKAIVECSSERQATGIDDRTISLKEKSHLSNKSLRNIMTQIKKSKRQERLKAIRGKIGVGFALVMPYMSLIAVVLCLINLILLSNIQRSVSDIQRDLSDVEHYTRRIYYDYEGVVENVVGNAESNIVDAIEDAESDIESSIDFAESSIETNIMLWR